MYEVLDKSKYTPMMRQYLEVKENFPDTLVFYRLGDFYEMFFNDAIVASKELEIVLTGRDAGVKERVPMCGVPHHAIDTYLEKLSEKGYKVAIVEQMEEAGNKKIVRRECVRVVTPGTNIDQSYLSEKSNNYLGAIDVLNDGYVFCYIELSTGECKVTKLPLNLELLIGELNKLSIKEVVASSQINKQIELQLTKVYGILISKYDNTHVDEYLQPLYQSLDQGLHNGCMKLLSYIVSTQKRVLVHLQPFTYYSNKSYLRLDNNCVRNLELVESLHGNKFKNNLFAILDHCSTAMGSRYLKKAILFPLVNLNDINERLDLITEFHKNYLLSEDLKASLSQIYDLERIIGRISYNFPSPKDLLQLKKSLGNLPKIKTILNKMNGKISKKYSDKLETFDELYTELDNALNEELPFLLKDGNVIKRNYSPELDRIRDIEGENKTFLMNLELKERERTKIKTLKVGYNRVFGYFIEVTKANLPLIKDEFGYIRKQTTSNSERFITEELKEREALILRSAETALNLEIELFTNLKNKCKEYTSRLQACANIISFIDMIDSLARCAKENNYVRPTFTLYDEFEVIDGRHPVIEKVSTNEFIPNDLTLYNNEKILLITGPNMSGKSTYMRQNAIIAIMAQMGSFVPCHKATLPIFDQIFTRIGSSDDIASGESTFMTEMLEVNTALQNATERSLIILDEVGRGTATFDGMALAQAIIEYLHDVTGAKTLFSTHYHELTSLDKSLSFLRNVHVEADTSNDDDELVFLHKVTDGPSDQSYGINVASLAKIPLEVTLRAKDILQKLENKTSYDSNILSKENYVKPIIINNLNKNEANVVKTIKELDVNSLKPIDALLLLEKLNKEVNNE